MEKNAWYVCGQVAERIDDAPILKDYIKSKVSEPPEKLFFLISVLLILIDIRGHQEETKWNSLVQYTSEISNRLWKTTTSVVSSMWDSFVMLRHRGDLQSRFLLF